MGFIPILLCACDVLLPDLRCSYAAAMLLVCPLHSLGHELVLCVMMKCRWHPCFWIVSPRSWHAWGVCLAGFIFPTWSLPRFPWRRSIWIFSAHASIFPSRQSRTLSFFFGVELLIVQRVCRRFSLFGACPFQPLTPGSRPELLFPLELFNPVPVCAKVYSLWFLHPTAGLALDFISFWSGMSPIHRCARATGWVLRATSISFFFLWSPLLGVSSLLKRPTQFRLSFPKV
jgi:hypothetical protein